MRAALAALPYDFAGAVRLGGTEKLRGGEEYGVPLFASLEDALAQAGPEVVVDLSDEPVATAELRFRLAGRALAAGIPYVGPDFHFEPVPFAPFALPSVAVLGTGKRVGKTAVAAHLARLAAREREVVVVAMGRGGPSEPVVVDEAPSVADLLERSRRGEHAASDYLEDAALAGVTTIGCRRCGGGLAGASFVSNVLEGARLAVGRRPDLVLFEGSGAAVPPVAADRRVLVAGAGRGAGQIRDVLGPYRVLLADAVVLTGCEEPLATAGDVDALRAAVEDVKPGTPVLPTRFRPRPAAPIDGRRVAVFTTAPDGAHDRLRGHLEQAHGAEVVLVSGALADRPRLRTALASPEALRADVLLVELKAAAVDVVAEAAVARGAAFVLLDNELVAAEDGPDVDRVLLALAESALAARSVAA